VAGGTQQQCRGWGAGDPLKVGGCVAGGAAARRLDVPIAKQQTVCITVITDSFACMPCLACRGRVLLLA
jgi:hypothetical protein